MVLISAEYEEQEPPEPLFPSDTSVIQEEVDSDDSDAVLHYFPPMISRTSSDIQPGRLSACVLFLTCNLSSPLMIRSRTVGKH